MKNQNQNQNQNNKNKNQMIICKNKLDIILFCLINNKKTNSFSL